MVISKKNILFGKKADFLIDFGLSENLKLKQLEGMQQTSWCGSLPYVAPEVLEGKSKSTASDIWAVGIILFEWMMDNTNLFFTRDSQELLSEFKTFVSNFDQHEHTCKKCKLWHEEIFQLAISMLSLDPLKRPSSQQILRILKEIKGV